MMTFFARGFAIFVCYLFLPLGVSFALEPGESIVLDPVTGNYKITYSDTLKGGVKVLSRATFVPSTKIDPTIDSKFHLNHTGAVSYSYTVRSEAQSRQVLDTVGFNLVSRVTGSQDLPTDMQTSTVAQAFAVLEANSRALTTPSGWRGSISTYENGAYVSWDPVDSAAGIQPKGQVKGFGFVSQGLPGVGAAKFKGARRFARGFGGEGPDPDSDIRKQYDALKQNDFVARNAVVPTIYVPVPFDAAVLLDSIRTHMLTWSNNQLLDPAFATQLDRYMVAAADAYRHNQPKAGKEHIQTLRKMLKKEHEDTDKDDEKEDGKLEGKGEDRNKRILIDRLAARVLDFDLNYVLKRMGDD